MSEKDKSTGRDSNRKKHRARILVADDMDDVRGVIAKLLRREGYEVIEAHDGYEAEQLVKNIEFDVIVSDISMPGPDGVELLRRIRKFDLDVPFILMTGLPSLESAIDAVEYGALHYFRKPVDNQKMREVVADAVKMRRIAKLEREYMRLRGRHEAAGDLAGLQASFESAMSKLWIAYQPLVSVADHSIYGYEALLRSREERLPHPGAVLEAAEQLGQVYELGRLVRRLAAEPVMEHPEVQNVFVNLHPMDLLDEELMDPDAPLSRIADRVVLEITERASIENITSVRERVVELRNMGFRIAVDDLGSGYAGLTSLATFEPEIVKIDMSLVRDIDKSSVKQKIVHGLTEACHDLSALVVAEGIETEEERDTAASIGCDILQGFRFSRPEPPFPEITW